MTQKAPAHTQLHWLALLLALFLAFPLSAYDDIPASAHMQPALTTVRQPFYEMGQRAIDLLLSLVDSPRPLSGWNGYSPALKSSRLTQGAYSRLQDEPVRIQLATNLVVRASCGASQRLTISS